VRNILPDYEITHILGVGGFATVYKAIGPSGKPVSIKIPRTDDLMATMNIEVIDRFRSEAEIWKRLVHDNIVTIYFGKTEPLPHMVIELMGGGNLKQLMKNHRLSVGEAVQIMQQVLRGLSFAHRMASVHRDLKPENILFTADGAVKISDWGIGKFMASVGKSQSVGIKGTLDYCAPEQFNKRKYGKVDWQTDIFQVGVMFYEMLTGENPFAGEDFADCMGNVLMFEPEPPSALNPDVPGELDDVIMGAVEKQKEDRWTSGAVMLNELRSVIGKTKAEPRKPKIVQWDIPPPPKKEMNICPECGNLIGFDNKKLRCINCRNFFCETCEGWIEKSDTYKSYKLEVKSQLCEDCYKNAIDDGIIEIEKVIEEEKAKVLDLLDAIDEKREKYREKGFKFFQGYNERNTEMKTLFNSSSFQQAYKMAFDLLEDLESHLSEKGREHHKSKILKQIEESILKRFREEKLKSTYIHPNIPLNILVKVRKYCKILSDAQILIVCDATVLKSAKNSLCITKHKIYFRNGWTSANPGNHEISWNSIHEVHFNNDEIHFGNISFNAAYYGTPNIKKLVHIITDIANSIPDDNKYSNLEFTRKDKKDSTCPKCTGLVKYIAEYDRWYCKVCKMYMPKDFKPRMAKPK